MSDENILMELRAVRADIKELREIVEALAYGGARPAPPAGQGQRLPRAKRWWASSTSPSCSVVRRGRRATARRARR